MTIASLSPVVAVPPHTLVKNPAHAVRSALQPADTFTEVAAAIAAPAATTPKGAPAAVAAVEPNAARAASPAGIARMRAEIEAEIERDRERIAHQRASGAGAKRFVLGV